MIEDDIKAAPNKLDTLIKCLPDAPYKAALLSEIESLRAECDAAAADARRFEILGRGLSDINFLEKLESFGRFDVDCKSLDEVRARIDEVAAAIAKGEAT